MHVRDIVMWRLGAAIFWSIAVQLLFYILVIFIINFNPWHPFLWLEHSISTCLSFRTWLYISPFALVMCLQGLVLSRDYVAVREYRGTRFAIIRGILSFHNVIKIGSYAFTGGVTTWIYLSLLSGTYSFVIREYSTDKKAWIVQDYLFFLLNGFWIGLYLFMQRLYFNTNTLSFPVVQQMKFLQVKAELQPLLKEAMTNAVLPTVCFFVFYFWKGDLIENAVCGMYECGTNEFSTFKGFGLINLPLLFYSWLSSLTIIIIMSTLKLLFQVHLTENIIFPIASTLGTLNSITLHQALCMKNLPIIQYLGFLDLKNLAEKSRTRREELFTLSQPGGHPYNWNNILAECLKLIRSFTEELTKASCDSLPEAKDHSLPTEDFPASHSVTTPTYRMRNLKAPVTPVLSVQNAPNIYDAHLTNVTNLEARRSLLQVLKLRLVEIVDTCKKPGISFFFAEIPDAKVKYCLGEAQPLIWAIQGLAYLSAASFREDSYGVVQKDLPAIIISLLELRQALDKFQKIGNYKKSHRIGHFELKMKCALRSAVKHSLYCMCIEFGEYLRELKLSKDVVQQLQPYLLYREG